MYIFYESVRTPRAGIGAVYAVAVFVSFLAGLAQLTLRRACGAEVDDQCERYFYQSNLVAQTFSQDRTGVILVTLLTQTASNPSASFDPADVRTVKIIASGTADLLKPQFQTGEC